MTTEPATEASAVPDPGGGSGTSPKHRYWPPRITGKVLVPFGYFFIFGLAIWYSQRSFPYARAPHLHIWVLALSIYAGMWGGVAALVMGLIRFVRSDLLHKWHPLWKFGLYLILNLVPLIFFTGLVADLSCDLKSCQRSPEDTATSLEYISVLVTSAYFSADSVAVGADPSTPHHRTIRNVDVGVLCVHSLMLSLMHGGPHIPILQLYDSELQPFAAGIMGVALIVQNIAFAVITNPSHDTVQPGEQTGVA